MPGTSGSNTGFTRRSFLKTSGALVGAAAVAGVATPSLQAVAAEGPAGRDEEKYLPGMDYFGGCFGCGYKVLVRGDRAVKVVPNPDVEYGRRPCLRGVSQVQRIYSPDRLKYPLRRSAERGQGQWERISWDEAVSEIAEKWKGYLDQYGGKSIALAGASGAARFLGAMPRTRLINVMQATGFDLSVDWAYYHGLHRVYGNPWPGTMTTPGNEPFEEDVSKVKTLFTWGHNLSEAYLQRWRFVMEAQERGMRVIAIDPNQTLTATRADKWYAPRPGSDPALMMSMIKVIIEEGLHDVAYLKKDTVGPYLVREDSKLFLRMSDLGVPPTEGPINPKTKKPSIIDPPVVWDQAAGRPGPAGEVPDPALEGSFEVGGIKTSTAFSLLVEAVGQYTPEAAAEITELSPEEIRELAHFAVDGPVSHMTGMGAQSYDNGLQVGAGMGTLLAVTGMVGKPGAGIVPAGMGCPKNTKFLMPTGKVGTTVSILSVADIIKTESYAGQDYPPIKSLFITSAGVVGGAINLNSILRDIIDKIDFVVCADTVMSDSARWADIVLPVCHSYEIEDIYLSCITNELKHGTKIVDPAFESKPDHEIVKLLGDALGFGEYFEGDGEAWMRELLDEPSLKAAGVTLDALREKNSLRFAPKEIAYADGKYSTPTGKVEIYAEKPGARIEFKQARDVDAEHMVRFYPPHEAWPNTSAMKKYPLVLISERSRNRWHSQGFDGVWLNEISPEPTLRINADDARARGIENGDYVEVFNDRGHAVAKAYLCAGMRPGMMSYPKGFQTHQYQAGNFAELSQSRFDPFAVNSSFFDTCVDVRVWDGKG